LVGVVLDGGGLSELASEVGRMLDGACLVTTNDGRILASGGDESQLLAALSSAAFDGSERFLVEKYPHPVHQVDGLSAIGVRVIAGRHDHGRLLVFSKAERYTSNEVHLVERAATVAALAITKSLAVQAVESKYRGDFVRDVLMHRAGDAEAVTQHFSSLGWDVLRPMVAVVATIDPEQVPSPALTPLDARTAQERFNEAWLNVVGRADPTAPVVGFSSEVVALLPVADVGSPRSVVEPLVRSVSGDGGGGRRTFGTGISRVITDPAEIPRAYEQARRAVHVGRQLQGPSVITLFDDLGAIRLLSLIDDVTELRTFVSEVLGELADEHGADAADMRTTLRVLLDTNLNVAETARVLHFHYNTLRYRISKLERIVGPFTSDPDLRLDLALALRVMQMRGL
jgi:purine catabolism regulator